MQKDLHFSFVELSTGIRMHLARCGSSAQPPLLLLHGFPEFWAAWAELMPLLAEDFEVIVPDLRGFNRSDKPTEVAAYRTGVVAADVLALLDALGLPSAHLAGHDWGGVVAWWLAIQHPHRIRALGICNAPHPYLFAKALGNDPAQQKASAYMHWLRKPGSELALLANDCALLERFFLGAGNSRAAGVAGSVKRGKTGEGGEGGDSGEGRDSGAGGDFGEGGKRGAPSWWTSERRARYREAWMQPGAMLAGTHYYRAAPWTPGQAPVALDRDAFRVPVPTLVLWGEKDEALLPVLLDGLEDFVDSLSIQRLPLASHWLLHEEPAGVAMALRRHFQAHPGEHAR